MIKPPTEQEIWEIFKDLLGGAEFAELRKLSNDQGVYLWEIRTTSLDGNIEYSYMREGRFPEGSATASRIDRVYLDAQDNPVGGDSIAKFIDGRWVIL